MNYYYLGNNLGLKKLAMGYKMLVDTRDLSLGAHVIADGYWAQHVDKFLSTVVRKGDRCLDLGCHMGYMTLLLHGLSGVAVDYVDMNGEYVKLTKANLELNGLSGKGSTCAIITNGPAGTFIYHKEDNRSGGAYLLGHGHEFHVSSNQYACVAKSAWNLGEYDFVKIDLEGMDWYVMDKIDPDRAIIEHRIEDASKHQGKGHVHDTYINCMKRVFDKYRVEAIQADGTGRIITTVNQILNTEHLDLYLEKR
jgi:hypothetical protein